jgi:hypothetical protein
MGLHGLLQRQLYLYILPLRNKNGGEEECIEDTGGKSRRNEEDLDVGVRIILKLILER